MLVKILLKWDKKEINCIKYFKTVQGIAIPNLPRKW